MSETLVSLTASAAAAASDNDKSKAGLPPNRVITRGFPYPCLGNFVRRGEQRQKLLFVDSARKTILPLFQQTKSALSVKNTQN